MLKSTDRSTVAAAKLCWEGILQERSNGTIETVARAATGALVSVGQRLQKGDNRLFLLLCQLEVAKLFLVQIRGVLRNAPTGDLLTSTASPGYAPGGWPSDVEKVCSTPAPPPASDEYPVHLKAQDRARADNLYDHFGLAIAAYELSPEVSPFTSGD